MERERRPVNSLGSREKIAPKAAETPEWVAWTIGTVRDPEAYVRAPTNPAFYTAKAMEWRRALRRHPLVKEALAKFWCVLDRVKDVDGTLGEPAYRHEYRKITLALYPQLVEQECAYAESVSSDWSEDYKTCRAAGPTSSQPLAEIGPDSPNKCAQSLDKQQFCDSLFQLADLW